MTDLNDLRARVEGAQRSVGPSLLSQVGASGLILAFNKLAPESHQIELASDTSMSVSTDSGGLDSRDVRALIDGFTRAVAALGREISEPAARFATLNQGDYNRAPIFVEVTGNNTVVLRPERSTLVMGQQTSERLSERALLRLANLLPSDANDFASIELATAARIPSRRALREVAAAAARVHGIHVRLHGNREEVRGIVTQAQAESIKDHLDVQESETHFVTMNGILDGARSSRRLFYLVRKNEPEISGIIDEPLVEQVFARLQQPVDVRLEVSTRRTVDGRGARPTYRLVALEVQQALEPDEGS